MSISKSFGLNFSNFTGKNETWYQFITGIILLHIFMFFATLRASVWLNQIEI